MRKHESATGLATRVALLAITALCCLAAQLAAQDTLGVGLPVIAMPHIRVHVPPAPVPAATHRSGGAPATARLRVERDADRVYVHTGMHTSALPVLSEPFLLEGRVRLYVTLTGTPAPAAADEAAVSAAGLLALNAETSADTLRLIVDAPGLRAYGMIDDDAGASLWLEPDSSGRANTAITPVLPVTAARAAARSAGSGREATDNPNSGMQGRAGATQGQPPQQAAPTRSSATATVLATLRSVPARLTRAIRAAGSTLAAAARRIATVPGRLPVLPIVSGAIALALLALGVTWLRRPRRSTAVPAAAINADARVWAARTLAQKGLDAEAIARQTGLPRDAAVLLVTGRPKLPVAAETSPRRGPRQGQARTAATALTH